MTLAPQSNRGRLYAGLAALFLTNTGLGVPKAEETGHHQFHDSHYRHWKQPGTNISCCSDHDCEPVKAEMREGRWFALRESGWFDVPEEMALSRRLPLRKREWIEIPDSTIIRQLNPTVEGAHLCYSGNTVLCFVPPNTGG
jgi:hypothetical protein